MKTYAKPQHKILLEELLESDGWMYALSVIAKKLANERTAVQTNLRRSLGGDLAAGTAIAGQARIDALVTVIYDLYSEAEADVPASVEAQLSSPARLR